VAARTGGVVRAAAFWSAVVLPVAVLAALVAGDLSLVGLLLAGNAAALVVGHDHRASAARAPSNHGD
jgi:Mg2+/citrate symporter